MIAAWTYGASEIVDPRKYTVKSISDTYKKYPKIGVLLPAMGYGDDQIRDLEKQSIRLIAIPLSLVLQSISVELSK